VYARVRGSRNCEDWDLSPIYTHTPFVVRGGNGTRHKEDMIVPRCVRARGVCERAACASARAACACVRAACACVRARDGGECSSNIVGDGERHTLYYFALNERHRMVRSA
jgi:hypothetical protein